MGLNFPSAPTLGQTYPSPAVSGLPVYTWDGEKWTTIGGNIGTGYAPIDSPLFVGDPRGPTQPQTDNDNSLATTAYVKAAVAAYALTVPPPATYLEFWANSAPAKLLSVGSVWDSAQTQALNAGVAKIPDFSLGFDFWCQQSTPINLNNPINAKRGQKGIIFIIGGGIAAYGSAWKFPFAVKPTATGGVDIISYWVWDPAAFIACNFSGNVS